MLFTWTGTVFEPRPFERRQCERDFIVGDIYRLEIEPEVTAKSRRHFHACVREAFANLPEKLAAQISTPEHLRKLTLIKAGYCNRRDITTDSPAEACKLAAFARSMDKYAIVKIVDCVVSVWTAESQKRMPKDRFQKSKNAVLDILAELTATKPGEIAAEAMEDRYG